jgi:hypothetical protein
VRLGFPSHRAVTAALAFAAVVVAWPLVPAWHPEFGVVHHTTVTHYYRFREQGSTGTMTSFLFYRPTIIGAILERYETHNLGDCSSRSNVALWERDPRVRSVQLLRRKRDLSHERHAGAAGSKVRAAD